jgi:hypothetical protein
MDLVFLAKARDDNNKLESSFLIVLTTNHEETMWQVLKAGKAPTYSGSLNDASPHEDSNKDKHDCIP